MTTSLPHRGATLALDREREGLVEAACRHVDDTEMAELISTMTSIPSPTGEERPLAEWLAARLRDAGLDARSQALDDQQANAWGRVPGSGGGPSLMLYAPIDTLIAGIAEEDVPWAGPTLDAHMRPAAVRDGSLVRGLGASNPKGHAACVLAAITAIARTGLCLRGDLLAGFGAGGMPTNARPGMRPDSGHGVGCASLLEHGVHPDLAVIAKPGWTVSWEEVGLAWVEARVGGTHTYVGSRHRLPFTDAIVGAAKLIAALNEWFPTFTARHTAGTVAPQAIVGAIEGGWWRMAAVTPAVCRFRVDLRLAPTTTPQEAHTEIGEVLDAAARRLGLQVEHELIVAIPGSHTAPDHPLVIAAVEAWEHAEGRPHEVIVGNSGATDANILRAHGVPTVRIGMPKVAGITDFELGMNTVDLEEMVRLTQLLIRVAINVTSRTREEMVP